LRQGLPSYRQRQAANPTLADFVYLEERTREDLPPPAHPMPVGAPPAAAYREQSFGRVTTLFRHAPEELVSSRPPEPSGALVSTHIMTCPSLSKSALLFTAICIGTAISTMPAAGDTTFQGHGAKPDRYETPMRLGWQRPDDVVKALQLKPGAVVADIGAGSGLFTRRFAEAVGPTGEAIGLEIDPAMVEFMKEDARQRGLAHYTARLVHADDPGLHRSSIDLVFLCNTFHLMRNRVAYFARLSAALRDGGRVAIVDMPPGSFGPGTAPNNPTAEQVRSAEAGFRLQDSFDFLLPRQFFLVFASVRAQGRLRGEPAPTVPTLQAGSELATTSRR
jgi:arsenite methyltransferase